MVYKMKTKEIFAFDLDGTLTQHKTIITSTNLQKIQQLSEYFQLVIVGAGSCERISNQLYDISLDIIGQYGLEVASLKQLHDSRELTYTEKNFIKINTDFFESKISYLRKKFNFQNYEGEGVEFHPSGIVTFPILGTKAKIEDKLKFDPDRKKRQSIFNDVQEIFKDYNVFIGGTSSFDISPIEFNKFNALKKYAGTKNISLDSIVYFGDDYRTGGNDESIYKSNIDFVKVDDFKELPIIIDQFIN